MQPFFCVTEKPIQYSVKKQVLLIGTCIFALFWQISQYGVKCLFLSCFFASKTALSESFDKFHVWGLLSAVFFRRCQSSCSISTGCCWKFLLCLIIQSWLYCSHSSFKFCIACSHCPVSTFDGAIKLDDVLSKRVKGVVDIHQQETVTTTSALCMDVHWAFRHLDLLQSQSLEANYRVICLCLWESCRVFSDFGNFDRFSQGNVTLIANRATSGTSPTSSFWHKEKKFHFGLFLKQQQQKRSWTPRIMIPFF